jgi:hypothetical protein
VFGRFRSGDLSRMVENETMDVFSTILARLIGLQPTKARCGVINTLASLSYEFKEN